MIYKIINYKTTSTLFAILLIILFFVIYYMFFYQKENIIAKALSIKTVRIIVCIVYLLIISFIPFDKIFFTFDSPKDMLKFYYPNSKIKKIYDYDDYVIILFSPKKGEQQRESYIRKGNSWSVDNTKYKIIGINNYQYFIAITESTQKNISSISIDFFSEKQEKKVIEDSLSSNFDELITKNNSEEDGEIAYLYTYFTVIKGKIDKDYTITIDGKKYKILDKKYRK